MPARFKRPPFFVAKVANPLLNVLVRIGFTPGGAHTLIVKGRKSGKERETPVNPLDFQGKRYLVAPRGTTNWVRNIRDSGTGRLRGRRRTVRIEASEVPVEDRPPILRAYLDRWGKITASQFEVRGDETVGELRGIAEDHPVFEIRETNAP